MRHQASQLESTKHQSLEEIERLRLENGARLKELEEMYIAKKTNSSVGGWIREKMGFKNTMSPKASDAHLHDKLKSDKKVRIVEGGDDEGDDITYNWKRASQKEREGQKSDRGVKFDVPSKEKSQDRVSRDINKKSVSKPILKESRSRSIS